MKLILSRKGFDSETGGYPSPILPDGRLISLPIPDRTSEIEYQRLNLENINLGNLLTDLLPRRFDYRTAHLDPDLYDEIYPRQLGWRPIFGHKNAAQTHLRRHNVTIGDLFLFFGWFRSVKESNGHYRYVRNSPGVHVLFGWIQIGEIISVYETPSLIPAWASYHPHITYQDRGENNTLYIASEELTLPGIQEAIPGGGYFKYYHPSMVLTSPGSSRSIWRLPAWFLPENGKPPLSYHEDPNRWSISGDSVLLRSAARGQEFILDADAYPEAQEWLRNLIIGNFQAPD